ncbi:hypothetical protein QS796_17660, partial [Providencia rettgeri]
YWHRNLSDSHLWLVSEGFIGFISLECAAWKSRAATPFLKGRLVQNLKTNLTLKPQTDSKLIAENKLIRS